MLLEHLLQKIFYKNRNLQYVFCNSNYARDLNISPDEIVGKTDYDFYPKKLAEKYRADDRSVIESGKAKEMEEKYIQDGREVFVHTVKTPVKDRNGNVGVLGIFWDTTEQKQVEKSLEVAKVKAEGEKNKSDAIIAALGDGIIIQDTDYKIIYQNDLQNKLYGNRVGELCYRAYEGRDIICEDCPIELSFKDGKIHKTIRRVPTDKGVLYAELTSSPLMDSAGNMIAGIKIVRDITEQKQVEDELRKARDGLEARVQERTIDLVKLNRALEIEVNERRQIETALRKSEERFKQVAQSSDSWIWEVDAQGLYTYSNSTVEKILGYSPEEIVGKCHFYDFFVPELRENLKKAALDVFAKKESFKDFLNSKVDKNGNIVFMETNGLPILDEQGNLLGYRGADIDVTDQKLHEEDLQEREYSYRALSENLPGIVYRVFLRENDRMQFFNDMVQSMTGYAVEELSTGDVCAIDPLILAEDRDCVRSIVKLAIVNNQPFQIEYRIMHKDGGIRYFYERGRPVYGADGKPSYVDGVIFDVSERKKADDKLVEQAKLLDKAQDAILVRDLKNSIIYWNMGAERLYGWKAEDVLGKDANQVLYNEKPAVLAEAQRAVIEKGEWIGEIPQVTKDDREITVQARWTLVRDSVGNPKSILIINTDVTEKKNLESQLLRAQRMEVVGALAGGVAHDINNVLTPIMLSLYILKDKLKDGDGENLIEILETSAKRGASLVKQIQTFARGAEGERKPVKISDVIYEVEKMTKETFPKNIEIRTYLDSNLQTISGNATEIHQVIMNLCVNARDAMPNGGTLGISAENITIDEKDTRRSIEAKVGPYVGITVTDTGTGISKRVIDKIFDPFFTTKEFGKGTGLGLSTALAIVKGHGGFINVYSEVGKGSTFKIYLPATSLVETEVVKEPAKPPTGHGETILVAEDEKSIREITAAMLEAYGYKTITANNGMDTIAMYMQNMSRVKVILIDMMMPIMDGPATIRTLRKINPNVKIIAVSGLVGKNKYPETIGTIQAFLNKPYTSETVAKTIHEVLEMPY